METLLWTNKTCLLDSGCGTRVVEDPARKRCYKRVGSQKASRIDGVEKDLELMRSQNSPDVP